MADQIVFDVHFQAAPGREKDLAQALAAVRAGSRTEPGCVIYELSRDPESPAKFLLYETFQDSAAHAAHLAAPHFLEFQKFLNTEPIPTTGIAVTTWRTVA
jgi:quinol monooxygenase YgiN